MLDNIRILVYILFDNYKFIVIHDTIKCNGRCSHFGELSNETHASWLGVERPAGHPHRPGSGRPGGLAGLHPQVQR